MTKTKFRKITKDLVKPNEHFIQHKNAMLDEMLDQFNRKQK